MRRLLFVGVLLSGLCCSELRAQSTNASVTGYITDPAKAVIVGAKVIVINVDTNIRYEATTNGVGTYDIVNLPPGAYRIEVEKPGFKTVVKSDVVLHLQDTAAINFEMALGSASEIVTVTAGGLVINTADASVSTVVDQTYVKNMPLNGRSFQDLILLTPGTVTQTPQTSVLGFDQGVGMHGEFSVNGQRTDSNNYTVDGVSANVGAAAGSSGYAGAGASGSVAAATALGTTQALVSVDDLQEFRVQSSSYSAEYGRNPGGQFAFETKSGTNQWHGTAYDYLRNGFFDAQDWFNDYFQLPEPAIRQNDFGGTFGGPVRIPRLYDGKDKTFFFVSYEGLRLTAPQPAVASFVPDLCLRGATTNCPAGIHAGASAVQPALNAYPVPNGPEGLMTVSCDPATDPACSPGGTKRVAAGLAQFIGTWSNPASLDSTSVRFDHAVSDKVRLFFRFSDTTSDSSTRGGSGGHLSATMNTTSAYTLRTYTSGVSTVFTSRLSNEFRLNYSSNEATSRTVIDAFGGNTPVDLAQLAGLGTSARPEIFLIYGGYQSNLFQQRQSGAQRQWNLVDATSLSWGRHQFRFGLDFRRLAPFAVPISPDVRYQFRRESAVETNSPSTFVAANGTAYPLYKNFSAFAQDEWKVSQRLHVSFGLRWEVNPAPGATQGLKPYTFQGSDPSTFALAPQGTPLWQTTWYNFAPRLGGAYILHRAPGWETVVRAGGGVFFDTGQQLGSLGFAGPGFSASAFQRGVQFPALPTGGIPAVQNPPVSPYNAIPYGFAPHLQLPYTLQWNASIEQAIGKSQALTVSFVGSHASRLLQQNAFITSNPNSGFFYLIENGLTSDYDSLQAQFRRNLSRGLTALASYTLSHCLDYGSQDYFSFQRGNCDFDVRHSLSAAFSYDLPNAGHSGFAKVFLHHWGLDDRFTARTAFPVTVLGGFPLLPNGQLVFGEAANLVPGQPVYLYGANCDSVLQGLGELAPGKGCPGGRAINPMAFVAVDSGGNAPRNFVRGFGAWQMNMAVRRDFPIHEGLKLQFRAEAFNTFNHPNFGTIDSSVGSGTFGQATGTLANSLSVLNPLYQMGGPRSMQFALKLLF